MSLELATSPSSLFIFPSELDRGERVAEAPVVTDSLRRGGRGGRDDRRWWRIIGAGD